MKVLIACLLVLGLSSIASAQNPTAVAFTPSPDHNTQVNGAPLVIRYDAVFKKVSDGSTVTTKDCGKPALAATVTCTLPTGLPGNTNLTATINTIWSGGAVPSVPSDPFVASVIAPAAAGKPTVQ